MSKKVKIVLDADVIIHFHKGGWLATLPDIFPEYEYVILDYVREELNKDERREIDSLVEIFRKITAIELPQTGEVARDYIRLHRLFGKGESACMAYCLHNHDIIGSSNVKDIKAYCEENGITYLTTFDFLYYAWIRSKMSLEEIKRFIEDVKSKGSKLPDTDFSTFVSPVHL